MAANPVINPVNNDESLHDFILHKLLVHTGHKIEIVTYGNGEPVNLSVECTDCYEVLYDFNITKEEDYEDGSQ